MIRAFVALGIVTQVASPSLFSKEAVLDFSVKIGAIQRQIVLGDVPADFQLPIADLEVPLVISGPDSAGVSAARVVADECQDDTGTKVGSDQQPQFSYYRERGGPIVRSEIRLISSLGLWSARASSFSFRGHVELIVPGRDPSSKLAVSIKAVRNHPIVDTDALHALGIGLAVHIVGNGDTFGGREGTIIGGQVVEAGDVAVELHDPHRRLVGLDIESANGALVAHRESSSVGVLGGDEDYFILNVPSLSDDMRLVLQFATDRSLVKLPFTFVDLLIPKAK